MQFFNWCKDIPRQCLFRESEAIEETNRIWTLYYLIHNYLFYNRFLLIFLSHVRQSMKILSPTELASHLETTAAILQYFFSKSLDTLTKKLLKYWQTSLNVHVIECLSRVWHSFWRSILKLRPRLAAKWLFTIYSVTVTVNTTYPMLLSKRHRMWKKQTRKMRIARSYLWKKSNSHGRDARMITDIALLWYKCHTRDNFF